MRMFWWIHNVHLFFPIITVDVISTRKRRIVWSKCFFRIYIPRVWSEKKYTCIEWTDLVQLFYIIAILQALSDFGARKGHYRQSREGKMMLQSYNKISWIWQFGKCWVNFFLGQTSIHKCSSRKRGRITISWFPKKDFPLRSSCQSLVNNFWYYCNQRVKKSQNKLLPRLIKNLATNLRIRNVIVCRYMYNVYI